MNATEKQQVYHVGDIVFVDNILAKITEKDRPNENCEIYSAEGLFNLPSTEEDMIVQSRITPVPITVSSIQLLAKDIKAKLETPFYEMDRENIRTPQSISASAEIHLHGDLWLVVDVIQENRNKEETYVYTTLWQSTKEESFERTDDNPFVVLECDYEYIHEIQHLMRAFKVDLDIEVK